MGGGGVDLPNVSYTVDENKIYYNSIQPNDEIWYTSTNNKIVEPYSGATAPFWDTDGNNIKIISNTNKNGKGIIKLEKDCYQFGDAAFYNCNTLSSIIIPNSVTSINTSVFSNCISLSRIIIPNSVTSIGFSAFEYCSSLTGITIPDKVTSIEDFTFQSCSSLTKITIPNKVTSIGNVAFSNCNNLTSIAMPNSVNTIGSSAFSGCVSLSRIAIPNNITTIANSTFSGASLSEITIPDKVASIGDVAFSNCFYLVSIIVLPTKPPTLGYEVFGSLNTDAKFYIHSSSIDAYISTDGWSDYADKIQAIP